MYYNIRTYILERWMPIKHFFINVYLFRVELSGFRTSDYGYNIDLFIKSLEITGKELITNGDLENSVEDGESALKAAEMLDKAYDGSVYLEATFETLSELHDAQELSRREAWDYTRENIIRWWY